MLAYHPSRLVGVCLTALALLFALTAQAAVTGRLSYQGFLATSGGTPVNGSVQMTFRLYTVSSGGAALWTETQTVAVANGAYTAMLGDVVSLNSVPFNAPYYLGVTIGADQEIAPRQLLASSPYAFRAAVADSVANQPVVSTTTRSATNFSGVGSSSCVGGEILVGGGCECSGAHSSGTNYGVVFACEPSGQAMVGGCYDYFYSNLYASSPIIVRAICLGGITFADSKAAEQSPDAETLLSQLRQRRDELSRVQPKEQER